MSTAVPLEGMVDRLDVTADVTEVGNTSRSLDASRMYCLSLCILSLNRYIATARPPIWAEDANPGGPVTSPMAKTRGFDVRKALST